MKGGDAPTGLEDFYAAAWPRLVVLMTALTGSRVGGEEVAQDAFVRLIPRWHRISTYDDPEAWLRRVAVRLASNRRRDLSRGRQVVAETVETAATSEAVEPAVGIDLINAIRALPIRQRQVVALYYLADLSTEQVSIELNLSPGTVKSRLSRARQSLAKSLRTDEERYV